MSPIALALPALLAAAPTIEWALAQRTGPSTATLFLVAADRRLQAICFDPDGLDPAQSERAQSAVKERTIWLYLGPRRVAQGHIEALESVAAAAGPCAVAARARFDEPLPLPAPGDVLWASTAREESAARRPLVPSAVARAQRALPAHLSPCFTAPATVAARGTEGGTYVGLVGEADGGPISALLLVPRQGPARLVALEPGRVVLLDVLDPQGRRGHTLAVAREVEGGRRTELWRVLESGVERLGAEGEY